MHCHPDGSKAIHHTEGEIYSLECSLEVLVMVKERLVWCQNRDVNWQMSMMLGWKDKGALLLRA